MAEHEMRVGDGRMGRHAALVFAEHRQDLAREFPSRASARRRSFRFMT